MGVAAKIGQNLFGAGKWRLGIDDPVDATRCSDGSIEGERVGQTGDIAEELKLAQIVGLFQLVEKQTPEQTRQDPYGQKEALPAGNPTGLVE